MKCARIDIRRYLGKGAAGVVLLLLILWNTGLVCDATEQVETIFISTAEDLQKMRENPTGNFLLERDIDLEGLSWEPLDFSGVLDGNGHSILNLTVTMPGKSEAVTYDGNMKEYDTVFAGFFGKLENAQVKNLSLIGVDITVETEQNCFLGGIAGYADNSIISGCEVIGELTLRVNAPMFGVGGVVGFGNGSIEDTDADTTLVCIDTNAKERDEQFLGGAYAAGYLNLDRCNIRVQGYISEHGYVHSGGLVGMYGIYPKGNAYEGYITDTYVQGKITFFEDNTNRRAYCKPYIGEVLHWTYGWSGCRENFEKDERYDYRVDLTPETCENPVYNTEKTASTETTYGYTTYICATCGYAYRDDYVLMTGELQRLAEEAKARAEEEAKAAARAEAEEARKAEEERAAREEALIKEIRLAEAEKQEEQEQILAGAAKRQKIITVIAGAALLALIGAAVIRSVRKRKQRN